MTKRGFLIFDLDGTLFRTETVTIPAVRDVFQGRGIRVPPAGEIRAFFGKPTGDFLNWIRTFSTDSTALESAVSRRELDLIPETGELFPGVREVLTALSRQVARMAVCSNGTASYVPRVIEIHGLTSFFDSVRYRGDSGKSKPKMVRELLDRFPDRPGIVIGDREDDIEAAHQNGLHAIAAGYGYGEPTEWVSADAIARTPSQLTELVTEYLGR
jgi:phosphoglycolate phosphatase-like HAD superfamily hydrolase